MPSTKKSINVRLDDDVYEYVKELADGYGLSMSAVVRSVLDARLPIIAKEKYTPQQFEIIASSASKTLESVGNCEINLELINRNLAKLFQKYENDKDISELEHYLKYYRNVLRENLKQLDKISNNLLSKW